MPTTSRFRGGRAFLASWYHALVQVPILPPTVDIMTPTQIAGALGLDRMNAVRAVPFPDELLDDAAVAAAQPAVPDTTTPTPERRLRRVIGGVVTDG